MQSIINIILLSLLNFRELELLYFKLVHNVAS